MKKKSFHTLLCFLVSICFGYTQQIVTDNSQQPEQLILNIAGNNCVITSNVSSPVNGNINNIVSYGSFNRGTSDFPLENGMVLSTGSVNSAGNTFIEDNLSEGNLNWQTDPDIINILGIDQTLNATSVAFDIVSANDFLTFRYLFASDEYQQEYPCNFRDVFAILIKRAGTTDPYINIATVPDTTTEVGTNTIHPEIDGFCDAQNETYFQGYNIGNTNFNGHTTVLTASTEIIPGETYHIKFVIADHIDQRFDSAVFIENGFGRAVDLGPDQSVCGNTLSLDAEINNPSATYSWFLNGTQIPGENNSTLEVNASGTYSVEISLPFNAGDCILTDSVDIEVIPFQQAEPISDLLVCDITLNDAIYDFDFSFYKDDEILANLPSSDYVISYHLTEDDAQNNLNAITGIYQNSAPEETIFIRIESLDGSCLQVGSFNLSVTLPPNISTLNFFLDICFDFITDPGITELNQFDVVMSNSEINRVVTYYMSESDAINRVNAITDFPDFSEQPPYVVARVEITGASNECFSLAYINFNYLNPPDLGMDQLVLSECIDPMYEEFEGTTLYTYNSVPVTFDIEGYFEYLETTLFPGSTVSTLELYGLGNPRTLVLTDAPYFTLRLGIAFENANCQTEIPLIVHKNLLYNVIGSDNEYYLCDDSSNDGMVDFNLADVAAELKGAYDDIDIDFYLTETSLQSNSNALDQTTALTVTNEQTLFIGASYDGCSYNSQVTLKIHPSLALSNYTFDYCGYTDALTNTTRIILEPLKENIINDLGITGTVEVYETLENAQNQVDLISGNSYDLSTNQDLYIRVTDLFTGCYDISTLQLNVIPIIETFNSEPIIICDEDQNLIATVNLEDVLDGLTTNNADLSITFHESLDHAVSEFYEFLSISDPSNYLTPSRDVYLRVALDSESCFTVLDFDVLIYADPQLGDIPSFVNCSSDPNDPSDFLLEDRDEQIINGQEGMQVLYFES
ncbi:MAG: choice-of-anchor L domain-containing protein, partial [Bacteroidota bacterium]